MNDRSGVAFSMSYDWAVTKWDKVQWPDIVVHRQSMCRRLRWAWEYKHRIQQTLSVAQVSFSQVICNSFCFYTACNLLIFFQLVCSWKSTLEFQKYLVQRKHLCFSLLYILYVHKTWSLHKYMTKREILYLFPEQSVRRCL